ncbi:MAG: LD-carboxypeptidase [Mycoplasmatales bacterium]|nr:LD-carboxypeptidase [Mycoplasmatales bacterium]
MKNKLLKKGDLVSLQSPSSGIAGDKRFFHRFLIGKKRIEKMGLKTVVSDHALKGIEFISNNPQKRADDLNNAFLDSNIKLIIANMGGFDSHKIIPFLDKNAILENPKPILGFSDITSLHLYLYTLGIKSYYGPTVLSGFAENVKMHELTSKSIEQILFTNQKQIINQSNEWTSEFLEWGNEKFDNISRKMNPEKFGQIWLNFNENISGHLIGGCLDTIAEMKNESFFPNLNYWKNSVIFLETSESKMPPQEFDNALESLREEINVSKGIIFGKPKDEEYFNEYLEIIKAKLNCPVIYNLNFGHTAPVYTLPYGGKIEISFKDKKIQVYK